MLRPIRARLHSDSGVSLVELLVVMMLMVIIGGVATTGLVRGMKISASTQTRFDALADLQRSVDRMTRELRAATPVTPGGAALVAAGPTQAVLNVYRANFTQIRRLTYQYCPTQGRVHSHVSSSVPVASASSLVTTTISCSAPAADAPPLMDNLTNTAAMFRYRSAPTSTAPQGSLIEPIAPATALSGAQLAAVRSIQVVVSRQMPGQPPIVVTTTVRLRNVR